MLHAIPLGALRCLRRYEDDGTLCMVCHEDCNRAHLRMTGCTGETKQSLYSTHTMTLVGCIFINTDIFEIIICTKG